VDEETRLSVLELATDGALTNEVVRAFLGVNSEEARRVLTTLTQEGLLEKRGATKGTHYVLPGSAGMEGLAPASRTPSVDRWLREPASKMSETSQGKLVLDLAGRGAVTNETVRGLLPVGSEEARRILTALAEEGLLERRGAKRGPHYVLTSTPQGVDAPTTPGPDNKQRLSVRDVNALKAQFGRRLQWDLREITRRSDYRPTYYQRMLIEHGGWSTARKLLSDSRVHDGLARLWELGLLKYSLEAAVLDPAYQELFTTRELETARQRLADLGFSVGH
jgi:transcription initiation factor IIE alpha subunit